MSNLATDAAALIDALGDLHKAERRLTLGLRTPRTLKRVRGSIVVLIPNDIEGNERRNARGAWLAQQRKEREAKRQRRRDKGMATRTATRNAVRERIASLAASVATAAERYHIDSTDLALFVKTWNPEMADRAAVVAQRVGIRSKDAPPPVVGIRRIDLTLKQIADSGTFQFFSNSIVLSVLGGISAVVLALVALLRGCNG